MEVIAVANRKGGVGKTTTAVHLAALLAQHGFLPLVVDMDSQANATLTLSTEEQLLEPRASMADVLRGKVDLASIVRESTSPGVALAPATRDLTAAVAQIVGRAGHDTLLRRALVEFEKANPETFDYVIIDTPPESHAGTTNALVAANYTIVPFTPDPTAIHGLIFVQEILADVVASGLNPRAKLLGALQIGYDKRLNATDFARNEVRSVVGNALLETAIRTNAKFLNCPGHHKDVTQLERGTGDKRGTEDFSAVVAEIVSRISRRRAA